MPPRSKSPANGSTGRRLVIVESQTKANKIQAYLGDGYDVQASVGHIRDLPTPSELPAEEKKGRFGKFAVDVDDGFAPYYVIDPDKKKKVAELRRALKSADELFLATDEDREGEAIAWHLMQVLEPKVPAHRMVFHEITRDAIRDAVENTRELDQNLVDAQETRRILDRLYGYEVSPVLWRKVRQGLSAGRVQSVATRLVVERERERMAFRSAAYWDIEGIFSASEGGNFGARLAAVDGARVATGRDFGSDGALRTRDTVQLDEPTARSLVSALEGQPFAVRSVDDKPYTPQAGRSVHDLDAACRRRAASCGRRPRPRCGWRSGSTRTATSPICAPTRRRCRSRRSTPPAPRPASSTARSTCRTPRAATSAR